MADPTPVPGQGHCGFEATGSLALTVMSRDMGDGLTFGWVESLRVVLFQAVVRAAGSGLTWLPDPLGQAGRGLGRHSGNVGFGFVQLHVHSPQLRGEHSEQTG